LPAITILSQSVQFSIEPQTNVNAKNVVNNNIVPQKLVGTALVTTQQNPSKENPKLKGTVSRKSWRDEGLRH
jgi:hypothetical protein